MQSAYGPTLFGGHCSVCSVQIACTEGMEHYLQSC